MLKFNINIQTKCFFYLEFDSIILYSTLGILKIKHYNFQQCLIQDTNLYYITWNCYLTSLINFIIKIAEFGYTVKYELIGMGYRQYYRNQCIVFQLWYNHLIHKVIPFNLLTYKRKKKNIKKKKNKRKYNSLFGFNKNKVNDVIYLWLSYRIKNVYTGKGISKKGKKYLKKQMIKKLL